jgi:hypothetical protein
MEDTTTATTQDVPVPQSSEEALPFPPLRCGSFQEWWNAQWFRTWLTLAGH